MALTHPAHPARPHRPQLEVNPVFTREPLRVPKYALPASGMDPIAYQIAHDELMLDGNARLNLANFVSTWMEPQDTRLMTECFDKNMIDKDEYPRTAELEERCVPMLAGLWHAAEPHHAVCASHCGTSTAKPKWRPWPPSFARTSNSHTPARPVAHRSTSKLGGR